MKVDLPNQVKRALHTIHKHGHEAYVIGGAIRDVLIGLQVHDYDIATSAIPSTILEIFIDYQIIVTGMKHGTVTVIIENMPIEITTYRVDGAYLDNRHPEKVTFTVKLKDDLERRDFTMNAIAFNEEHGIIDFFNGKKDIKNKIIRCVGDPDKRFKEDALRIIRALRFSSILDFNIEKKTAQSIHTNIKLLKNISIERITAEFSKMICGQNIKEVLLSFSDIISALIPGLMPLISINETSVSRSYNTYGDTVNMIFLTPPILHLRLAILLNNLRIEGSELGRLTSQEKNVKVSRNILEDMRFNKDTVHRVYTLILYYDLEIIEDETRVKRWMNQLTPIVLKEILHLRRVKELYQGNIQKVAEIDQMIKTTDRILKDGDCYQIKDLHINGLDILNLGVMPGRLVGDILDYLLEEVIQGNVNNNQVELLILAQEYLRKQV